MTSRSRLLLQTEFENVLVFDNVILPLQLDFAGPPRGFLTAERQDVRRFPELGLLKALGEIRVDLSSCVTRAGPPRHKPRPSLHLANREIRDQAQQIPARSQHLGQLRFREAARGEELVAEGGVLREARGLALELGRDNYVRRSAQV